MAKVVRYESLNEELAVVVDKLGIPFEGTLGVKAKSRFREDKRPYQELYNEEQRKIVKHVFLKEIEMYGYTF